MGFTFRAVGNCAHRCPLKDAAPKACRSGKMEGFEGGPACTPLQRWGRY